MRKATPNEGELTKKVEKQTAKVPSMVYLGAAALSIAASLSLKCAKKGKAALFVGQWVAPFLLLGIYNKMVKTEGHD